MESYKYSAHTSKKHVRSTKEFIRQEVSSLKITVCIMRRINVYTIYVYLGR